MKKQSNKLQNIVESIKNHKVGLLVALFCSSYVFWQLSPELILNDSTPTGGDLGAHVWGPQYLKDHILGVFRISNWTPDWYAGFPAFQFYMVIPSIAIVILDFFLPYGTAFKLVVVSGVVLMPLATYSTAVKMELTRAAQILLPAGTLLFLFDRQFSIYGGNILSTMAGEFAFSIALAVAVWYLGFAYESIHKGKSILKPAILLALVGLNHLIVAFFAVVATLVLFALKPNKTNFKWLVGMGGLAGLLSAWWVIPFYFRQNYLNDMGWEKITEYSKNLMPETMRYMVVVAVLTATWGIVRRNKPIVWIAIVTLIFAFGFVAAPQGRLWNTRLLPFYYLCLYWLAAMGVGSLITQMTRGNTFGLWKKDNEKTELLNSIANSLLGFGLVFGVAYLAISLAGAVILGLLAGTTVFFVNNPIVKAHKVKLGKAAEKVFGTLATLCVIVFLGLGLGSLPGLSENGGTKSWLGISTTDNNYIPGWAEWNFEGYEGKAHYEEYYNIVQTMIDIGENRGCGRAMWEYDNSLNDYGTPMALMLLPYWSDSCIGSMEGLYFEASATTPYHFINQTELSRNPSSAQRELPYQGFQFDQGIQHMQMYGVKYYMAITQQSKDAADTHADLTEIGETVDSEGETIWKVYEIADAELVQALNYEPVKVLEGHDRESWLFQSIAWYQSPENFDVMISDNGPDSWQETSEDEVFSVKENEPEVVIETRYDLTGELPKTPVEENTVTNIQEFEDNISFSVSNPGQPVLVKVSYFPNWEAKGADGPYRVAPNLMVVVPTSENVELIYGVTKLERVAQLLTVIGLLIAAGLVTKKLKLNADPIESDDMVNMKPVREPVAAHAKKDDSDVTPEPV